jgi:hypothetical protein
VIRTLVIDRYVPTDRSLPSVELVGPDLAYDRRRPKVTGLDADDCRHLRVAVPVCQRQP